MLVDEFKRCGETLIGISKGPADLFSDAGEAKQPAKKAESKKKTAEEPKPEKLLTLGNARAVCADKSRKGFAAEIGETLAKHGADKLPIVDPTKYKALLAEVEVLCNAG